MPGLWRSIAAGLRAALSTSPTPPGPSSVQPTKPASAPARPASRTTDGPRRPYPGDYHGPLTLTYDPHPDDVPDPGEVVWTWVPFEEDYAQGKDRPVLIVARENTTWLLALMLSSQNHDLDREQEASEGRFWVEIGSGEWDKSGRRSAVRVNRVIRVDATAVRRIGGRLDKERFDVVAREVRQHYR